MNSILEYIYKSKNGDSAALLELIKTVTPLLKKYGRMLNYEDAYNDLELFFIQLIHNFKTKKMQNKSDGALINYIEKSIYYQYISLSQSYRKINNFESIAEGDIDILDIAGAKQDDYSFILFKSLSKILSKKEYQVIIGIYWNQYTIIEISEQLNQSNWNVYKLRNSAFSKIKNFIN